VKSKHGWSTRRGWCAGCGAPLRPRDDDAPGSYPLEKLKRKAWHKELNRVVCNRCSSLKTMQPHVARLKQMPERRKAAAVAAADDLLDEAGVETAEMAAAAAAANAGTTATTTTSVAAATALREAEYDEKPIDDAITVATAKATKQMTPRSAAAEAAHAAAWRLAFDARPAADSFHAVGGASALVTFMRVLCTLRIQIS
jgi:hypothetical protein